MGLGDVEIVDDGTQVLLELGQLGPRLHSHLKAHNSLIVTSQGRLTDLHDIFRTLGFIAIPSDVSYLIELTQNSTSQEMYRR